MLSIPPATTIWEFPVWIACCASATAFSPDQIAQAKTPARLLKKVGSVGHALHSASDNDLGVPCLDRLLCERDCLQPRPDRPGENPCALAEEGRERWSCSPFRQRQRSGSSLSGSPAVRARLPSAPTRKLC